MYKIMKTDGTELGITDTIRYIKVSKTSGCYIGAEPYEACGIAFECIAYNLKGHNEINGADEVYIQEVPFAQYEREQRSILYYLAMKAGVDLDAISEQIAATKLSKQEEPEEGKEEY